MKKLLFILLFFSSLAQAQNGQALFFSLNQTSIPAPTTSGLIGWWRGDQGVIHSGGIVSQWIDQSGSGNNFTATSGPSHGGGRLLFDGVTQAMQVPALAINSSDVTIILVAKKNNNSTTCTPLEFSPNFNSSNAFAWVWNDASAAWDYAAIHQNSPAGYNANGTTTGRAAMAGATGVYILSFNASDPSPETSIEFSSLLYQSVYNSLTANTSVVFGTNSLNLGGRNQITSFAAIEVWEIRMFNRKLTSTERDQEKTYLKTKYNLL